MLDKLQNIQKRYDQLNELLSDPEIIGDQQKFMEYAKESASLSPIVDKFNEYQRILTTMEDAKEMLKEKQDPDFEEMLQLELEEAKESKSTVEEELKVLLLPKDPNDDKNIIVEVRGGTGGDEAALFAGDLFRMYSRYAERQGWKTEIMSSNENDIGGYKEIVFTVVGNGAYSRMKFESGVHRVQRVPDTESSGRIHTSAATVAVLPEAEEVDITINAADVRFDVYRSSGPGGQSVNTTDSAVRVTHLPTGLVVSCQDEKSQLKNKEKAMRILRARLYDLAREEANKERSDARKGQVGSGDRSERIRTYNFPQGRVTDHRISLTIHQLAAFLDGDLDDMINALVTEDQAQKIAAGLDEA